MLMLLSDCCDCVFALSIPKLAEKPCVFKSYVVSAGLTNTQTRPEDSSHSAGNEWVAFYILGMFSDE